jgi:hypothetical protein
LSGNFAFGHLKVFAVSFGDLRAHRLSFLRA